MNPVQERIVSHLPDLKRYARHLASSAPAADDLVQECALRALDRASLFRPGTNLKGWLFTILHNLYVSEMRRRARSEHAIDPAILTDTTRTPARQDGSVLARQVLNAVDALPRDQRRAIELIALEGRGYESAARTLGMPVGTLKSRVSRARSTLRARIDPPARRAQPGKLAA
jgi:RNA polymerase sigma-70 factor (ECF subfamily)